MKKVKKLTAVVLCLAFVISAFCVTAFAAQNPAIAATKEEFLTAVADDSVTEIKLTDSINLDGAGVLDISGKKIDLGGNTISSKHMTVIFEGENFTICNGKIASNNGSDYPLFIGDEGNTRNVLVENITVVDGGINVYNAEEVVLKNVTGTGKSYYAVWCDNNAHVTIDGGTFQTNGVAVLGMVQKSQDIPESTMKIVDGNFYTNGKPLVLKDGNDRALPVISGGHFDAPVEKEYLDSSLKFEANNSGTYTYHKTVEEAFAEAGENGSVSEPGGEKVVAQINEKTYPSLDEAIKNAGKGDTIRLLTDVKGNGVVVASGTDVIIDFNGHTYDIDGATVGSTGTETNGFQLLKDSNITMKNGTITSGKALILIQNYSNLTLLDMNLDGSKMPVGGNYTLSNNYGDVNITGKTSITAAAGNVAFDVCYWPPYYAGGVKVTVDTTGTITGPIEYTSTGTESATAENSALVIKNINLEGTIDAKAAGASVSISGGTFSSEIPEEFCAEGFHPVKMPDGSYGVCDHSSTEIRNAKEATCTEKGYTGDTYCKDCGALLEAGEEIPMTEHQFEWVIDKEATATEKGSKHEECTVCGYAKEAVEIPAEGNASDTSKPSTPGGSDGQDGTPATGGSSHAVLWIVVMFAALSGMAGTVLVIKKRKGQQ